MKLAVVTDASAVLQPQYLTHPDLKILDIPVTIDGVSYIEGQNLTTEAFYQKMAASADLPKTSQPSLMALEEYLKELEAAGYTHVLGLFLSSGISGFWPNIQFLKEEFPNLTIAFPDTKLTSSPMGAMVEKALDWKAEQSFETIVDRIQQMIDLATAYIMVDDLNHLVKGGRLSNGAALLGNLLKIKPILYFNQDGVIEVFEKVRSEKKAQKRLIEILQEAQAAGHRFTVDVIHANVPDKAAQFQTLLAEQGFDQVRCVTFGSVIGTHLGEGAIAVGILPLVD